MDRIGRSSGGSCCDICEILALGGGLPNWKWKRTAKFGRWLRWFGMGQSTSTRGSLSRPMGSSSVRMCCLDALPTRFFTCCLGSGLIERKLHHCLSEFFCFLQAVTSNQYNVASGSFSGTLQEKIRQQIWSSVELHPGQHLPLAVS
uniref:(northern house mosquito) hypothetical protein n=1 Tax=Culex pipiens TaxID=7175 RepID=A0A8D8FBK5_CULPI